MEASRAGARGAPASWRARRMSSFRCCSKRDGVVQVAALRHVPSRPIAVARARVVDALTAVEEGQRSRVGRELDLRRIAVVALLVLPLARGKLALDEDLRALGEVLLGDLGEPLVEDDDAMPLGALAPLTGLRVLPRFGGGDAEADDALAALRHTGLGIAAEIADQGRTVQTAGHGFILSLFVPERAARPRAGCRSLGCGRRKPGAGPPAPEWRGLVREHRDPIARARWEPDATRQRCEPQARCEATRGCGSGPEPGLDRSAPRDGTDAGAPAARLLFRLYLQEAPPAISYQLPV